jgi:hypothetical protein
LFMLVGPLSRHAHLRFNTRIFKSAEDLQHGVSVAGWPTAAGEENLARAASLPTSLCGRDMSVLVMIIAPILDLVHLWKRLTCLG